MTQLRQGVLPSSRQRGMALILLLTLLSMGVLYFIMVQLESVGKYQLEARQGRSGGSDAIEQARQALIAYAATYRDTNTDQVFGYLPCPDTAGAGETASTCGNSDVAAVGLLPYKTLGLPDLRDAQGDCLWYAVSGAFKNSTKSTTQPMNWDTQGQFSITAPSGGFLVQPGDAGGGAAAVIFSPGTQRAGQARSTSTAGPCGVNPANVSAYLDGNYDFTSTATIALVQGPVSDASGNVTNNDQLAWISPKEIFDRIVVRKDFSNADTATPPGLINTLSSKMKLLLDKKIQDDLVAGTSSNSLPANTGSFTQPSGKQVGTITDISASLSAGSDTNLYQNWYEQYRQVSCSTLSTACLTIAGTACRGALMFGGRGANGQPRSATQRAYSTANLANFFESGSGLDILNSATTSFSGLTAYTENGSAAGRALDVATCLFPGSFVSAAQDIASFASGVADSGSALAAVNIAGQSITLGNSGGAGGSGCVWYSNAIDLTSSMRMFFTLNFTTKGNGFAFALADGATNLAPASPYRTQIMCGASGSTRMAYAGSPPGGTGAPGIQKPKVGIEFDTLFNSTRNDPPGDHMAFLYWGTTSDSDGADDNTHYLGVGPIPVSAASWASNTATLTTPVAHGLTDNQVVTISGVSPSGYNATATITAHTTNTLSYAVTSNPGAYASGGQVTLIVNPNTASVTNASWASSTATLTTAAAHGFAVDQMVTVSGVTPSGYNGTYAVTAVTATTFSYALTTNPGAFSAPGTASATTMGTAPRNPRVATATRNAPVTILASDTFGFTTRTTGYSLTSGNVSIVTQTAHGLSAGDQVVISGVNPSGYNGTFRVLSSGLTTTRPYRFRYAMGNNPGAYVSGGTANKVFGPEISALSWAAATATATTPSAHGLSSTQNVTTFGMAPSAFGTTANVSVTGSTGFTYPLAGNPGGNFTRESPAGMAMVKSSDTNLPYSSFPTGTNIHVRLDLDRSYDSTNHVALLSLKAYIGNTFPLADACGLTDLQNLAANLDTLCPSRAVTLQQTSIPINVLARISSASWSSATNLVTVNTAAAHGLVTGAKVTVLGATPTAYNGTNTVTVTGTNSFTYGLASDPGAYVSGGDIAPFTTFYFGFTNSRASTNTGENQSVSISGLMLRSQ